MISQNTACISLKVDSGTMAHMEEFFDGLGMTLSCGIKIFFEHCIMNAGLPFASENSGKSPLPGSIPNVEPAEFLVEMEPYKKSQIEYVFKELGITPTEAVNLYFRECLSEWGIPFRVGYHKPNAETLAAMKEMEDMDAGRIPAKSYASWEEAKAAMDAEDAAEDEGISNP